jgi:hypothetical protein
VVTPGTSQPSTSTHFNKTQRPQIVSLFVFGRTNFFGQRAFVPFYQHHYIVAPSGFKILSSDGHNCLFQFRLYSWQILLFGIVDLFFQSIQFGQQFMQHKHGTGSLLFGTVSKFPPAPR